MSKQGLKATGIKLGHQCIMVKTEDLVTGEKGVRVIKGGGDYRGDDRREREQSVWANKFQN